MNFADSDFGPYVLMFSGFFSGRVWVHGLPGAHFDKSMCFLMILESAGRCRPRFWAIRPYVFKFCLQQDLGPLPWGPFWSNFGFQNKNRFSELLS